MKYKTFGVHWDDIFTNKVIYGTKKLIITFN